MQAWERIALASPFFTSGAYFLALYEFDVHLPAPLTVLGWALVETLLAAGLAVWAVLIYKQS